jgi:hypothetical protein
MVNPNTSIATRIAALEAASRVIQGMLQNDKRSMVDDVSKTTILLAADFEKYLVGFLTVNRADGRQIP